LIHHEISGVPNFFHLMEFSIIVAIEIWKLTINKQACHYQPFPAPFRKYLYIPRELSSVGRNIALYMQEQGFKPRTLHLFAIKVEFLVTRLIDKKRKRRGDYCSDQITLNWVNNFPHYYIYMHCLLLAWELTILSHFPILGTKLSYTCHFASKESKNSYCSLIY
jgi:hypothetical protein